MAGIETRKCSVKGCNFSQDGKCFIVERVRKLAENGIYTRKDWEVTIRHFYGLIENEGCINKEANDQIAKITPKNVVLRKEKIV